MNQSPSNNSPITQPFTTRPTVWSDALDVPPPHIWQRPITGEFEPQRNFRSLGAPIADIGTAFGLALKRGNVVEIELDGAMTRTYVTKTSDTNLPICVQQCLSWRVNKSPSVMPAVAEITDFIAEKAPEERLRVPRFFSTPSGSRQVMDFEAKSWVASQYIPCSASLGSRRFSSEIDSLLLGATTANLHQLLADFEREHPKSALKERQELLPDAAKWYGKMIRDEEIAFVQIKASSKDNDQFKGLVDRFFAELPSAIIEMNKHLAGVSLDSLPSQIVHGNLLPSNILRVDGQENSACLAVVSFQKLMFAPREYDAAVAISEYAQLIRAQFGADRAEDCAQVITNFFEGYRESGLNLQPNLIAGFTILRAIQNALTILERHYVRNLSDIDFKLQYYLNAVKEALQISQQLAGIKP